MRSDFQEVASLSKKQRKYILLLLIMFFLTIVFLELVDLFTFRLKPGGHLSGNGNPALLFFFIFIPLYVLFIGLISFISSTWFIGDFKRQKYHVILLFLAIILILLLVFMEYLYMSEVFSSLGGSPDNPDSVIYRWGRLNQYTNTAYINMITYSLGILMSIIIGYVVALVRHVFSRNKG